VVGDGASPNGAASKGPLGVAREVPKYPNIEAPRSLSPLFSLK
jgi:hypothetical protein